MTEIPVEELHRLFLYDPTSGTLVWAVDRNNRTKAGSVAGFLDKGRMRVQVDGRSFFVSRIAWAMSHGKWPTKFIDHINCDPNDNRIANLREASPHQNSQNRRRAKRDSHSGVLGIKKNGRGWQARIQISGKLLALGTFPTQEEAHAAYVAAKRRLHPFGTL